MLGHFGAGDYGGADLAEDVGQGVGRVGDEDGVGVVVGGDFF